MEVIVMNFMLKVKHLPSHDKILNVWPPMQVLQKAATMFTQKNGTQHTTQIENKEKWKRKHNITFQHFCMFS
jgi:hypothetical protein